MLIYFFESKLRTLMRTRNESASTTGAFFFVIFGFILYVTIAVIGVLEVLFRYWN